LRGVASAVNVHPNTCDPFGIVRRQKQRGLGDVFSGVPKRPKSTDAHSARRVPSRTQLEVETFVPLFFGHFQTRQSVRQIGVADEYVELAGTAFNFVEKTFDILAPDDINVDGEGALRRTRASFRR
jgi:hypothetical protein